MMKSHREVGSKGASHFFVKNNEWQGFTARFDKKRPVTMPVNRDHMQ